MNTPLLRDFLFNRKFNMKRQILVFISIFTIFYSSAQVIISNDTNFCSSQPHDLYALSAVQSSMAIDDQHDSIASIGFNFDFYGGTYDKCVISGNGYISFDTTQANQYSPWAINQACLLYTSPSPRDQRGSRMPSSA